MQRSAGDDEKVRVVPLAALDFRKIDPLFPFDEIPGPGMGLVRRNLVAGRIDRVSIEADDVNVFDIVVRGEFDDLDVEHPFCGYVTGIGLSVRETDQYGDIGSAIDEI